MRIWKAFVEVQSPNIRARLQSFSVLSFHARSLKIQVRTPFDTAWFDEHLRERFEAFAKKENAPRLKLSFVIEGEKPAPTEPDQLFPAISLSPDHTLDDFIFPKVDPWSKIFSSPDLWCGGQYNPICFSGPKRSGKTHLLQAICRDLRSKGIDALYLHAKDFVSYFTRSLRSGDVAKFRALCRNTGALVIDEVDLLANKKASQEEFFHTFNTLYAKQVPLFFSLSISSQLTDLQERISTRLQWGLTLPLSPLSTPEEIHEALAKKAHFFGCENIGPIIDFLLETLPSFAVASFALKALLLRENNFESLTVERTRLILADIIEKEKRVPLTPDGIIKVVSKCYHVTPSELLGKNKAQRLSRPRKVAMYLIRKKLRLSYPAIGVLFGRDHSSVMAAVRSAPLQVKDLETVLNE